MCAQAWSEGGYSDDLIVAAKCGEAGLRVLCPSSAVFRQTLVSAHPLEDCTAAAEDARVGSTEFAPFTCSSLPARLLP